MNNAESAQYILELKQLTKKFPGVIANDHLDLNIKDGEIHTILGENGAGKTTLMRIIYGIEQPDFGEIIIKGEQVKLTGSRDAINRGIGMVHQHFMLVESLTVAENILLGTAGWNEIIKSPRKFFRNLREMEEEVKRLSEKVGFEIDPRAKIWELSAGEQQRVEILKAFYRGVNLLILDEPTSVLAPQEVEEFFSVLKEMNKQGVTIIFISHILEEALEISDRITVLRDGKKV